MYSFACYMEADAMRLSGFAKMIRQIESSNQIPPPIEIAKFFGFATVAEFEADWKKFILATDMLKDRPQGSKSREDAIFGADFMRELDAVITYTESRIFLIQR